MAICKTIVRITQNYVWNFLLQADSEQDQDPLSLRKPRFYFAKDAR